MPTLLFLLLLWPFPPRPLTPGHAHSRAAHARHLHRIQAYRAKQLAKQHAPHPSLIHR